MRSIVLVLALAALPAQATLVLQTDNMLIRLENQPCTHAKVVALVKDEWVPRLKQGHVEMQGRQLQMCWTESREGFVIVIDEDGDSAEIPRAVFKQATSA